MLCDIYICPVKAMSKVDYLGNSVRLTSTIRVINLFCTANSEQWLTTTNFGVDDVPRQLLTTMSLLRSITKIVHVPCLIPSENSVSRCGWYFFGVLMY